MFTLASIEEAHDNVKSGADFPKYIKEIKDLDVTAFETWVGDGHTEYLGKNGYRIQSEAIYKVLIIAEDSDKKRFEIYLKAHQKGETDYYSFCKHCAETGIEKWVMLLDQMSCTYFDKAGDQILKENIPQ